MPTIVLDCSTLDRIGPFAARLTDDPAAGGAQSLRRVAVIDHHSSGEPFGEVRFIDPQAPSTTYLVQLLMEETGKAPDRETAQWLLFGLCTDTGFFRHLTAGAGKVLSAAARLTDAGADLSAAYKAMYGGRSLSSRRLLGTLLSRTESYADGRLLLTWETLEDTVSAGSPDAAVSADRDSDTLYSLLQGVKDAEAVVYVREEGPGVLSAGLRSNNALDVGTLSKEFGGGGHKKASGLEWKGNLLELKNLLIKAILREFKGQA